MADPVDEHVERCPTRKLLLALAVEDIEQGIAGLLNGPQAAVLAQYGMNRRGKSNPRAVARVIRSRLRSQPADQLHQIESFLSMSAINDLEQVMSAREPTPEDDDDLAEYVRRSLSSVLPELLAKWRPGLVKLVISRLWHVHTIDDRVRDELIAYVDNPTGEVPSSVDCFPEPASIPTSTDCRERNERDSWRLASVAARGTARLDLTERASPVENSLDALVTAAISAAQVQPRPPGPMVRTSLEWLIGLDPTRAMTWYPYGLLLSDTSDSAVLVPPTEAAREQFLFGRIASLSQRGHAEGLAALVRAELGLLEEALAGERYYPMLADALVSLLRWPRDFARVLPRVASPIEGWERLARRTREEAEELIDRGGESGVDAEMLLQALQAMLDSWAASASGFGAGFEHEVAELLVLRAAARRRRRDYTGCLALLDRVDDVLLTAATPPLMARLAEERAAATCEVHDIRALRIPSSPSEWMSLGERLRRAAPLLKEAERGKARGPLPGVLLGLLDLADGRDAAGAQRLAVALQELSGLDGVEELAAALRFHAALARLRLLEPGSDEACYVDLTEAMGTATFEPSDDAVVAAAEALYAHDSVWLAPFLDRFAPTVARTEVLCKVIAEAARSGVPDAIGLIERLVSDPGAFPMPVARKFAMMEAALEGANRLMDGDCAERLVTLLDDIVSWGQDAEFEQRWATLLGENDVVRHTIGPASADALRIDILRRLGRLDDARSLAEALFYRAASNSVPEFDPLEILELLRELNSTPTYVEDLLQVIAPGVTEDQGDEEDESEIVLLFVGGNETQQSYRQAIDLNLAERYRGSLRVEWVFPGWGSNWSPLADQIERRFAGADALVLMAFVRTMFGRRLRRKAGQADLPWIACTGHGRASIELAIDRAVVVARARRRRRRAGESA